MNISNELRKKYCLYVNNFKYSGDEKPLGYGRI